MELSEFFEYKNQLMKELCCNENIVRLVTGNDSAIVPNHTLPYTQLFPYEFVPDTEDKARTFICFDVDVAEVINKTFYVPVLYVWVFAHKSNLHMESGGVLIDQLAVEVNKMLNGSRYYGMGEMNLDSVDRFSPVTDYLGRVLTFVARDFNRSRSQPVIPSNRKR